MSCSANAFPSRDLVQLLESQPCLELVHVHLEFVKFSSEFLFYFCIAQDVIMRITGS